MRKCTNCGRECRDNEYTCIDCGGMTSKADSGMQNKYVAPVDAKEQIIDDKLRRFMKEKGLEPLNKQDAEKARNIARQLLGNNLIQLGTALSFTGKTEDLAKMSYLSALVDQNWMIISQLDRLNKNIEKLIEK